VGITESGSIALSRRVRNEYSKPRVQQAVHSLAIITVGETGVLQGGCLCDCPSTPPAVQPPSRGAPRGTAHHRGPHRTL